MQLSFQIGDETVSLIVEPDGEPDVEPNIRSDVGPQGAPDGVPWRVRLPDGTVHRLVASRLPDDILQIDSVEIQEGLEIQKTESITAPVSMHARRVPFARLESGLAFSLEGQVYTFAPREARPSGGGRPRASGALTAPMVGVVTDVLVQEGQTVEAYQRLVVIEAMKVIMTLEAPFAGTVQAIHVHPQEQVAHGAPVIDIAPQPESSEPHRPEASPQ